MLFAFAMSAVAWVFVLACSAATSTSPEIVLQTAPAEYVRYARKVFVALVAL